MSFENIHGEKPASHSYMEMGPGATDYSYIEIGPNSANSSYMDIEPVISLHSGKENGSLASPKLARSLKSSIKVPAPKLGIYQSKYSVKLFQIVFISYLFCIIEFYTYKHFF